MDDRDRAALDWEIKTHKRELEEIEAAHARAVAEYERTTGKLRAMLAEKLALRGDPVPIGSLEGEDIADVPRRGPGRHKKS